MDVFLGYQQVGQFETRNERVKELAAKWNWERQRVRIPMIWFGGRQSRYPSKWAFDGYLSRMYHSPNTSRGSCVRTFVRLASMPLPNHLQVLPTTMSFFPPWYPYKCI